MRSLFVPAVLLIFAAAGFGQTAQPTASPQTASMKSFIADLDKTVDPCTDFYQFACGNWMKENPIPPDHVSWGSFSQIYERNLKILREILEKAGAGGDKGTPIQQKVGDFYASCMDESAVNRKGYEPLRPELARIAAIKSTTDLFAVLAHDHRIGSGALLSFSSGTDFHNANLDIAFFDQGGLSLPDRDYYLKSDEDMVSVRKAFVDHMKKMFVMIGETPQQATRAADDVLRIETALAKISMDRTQRRDPQNLDHPTALADFEAANPNLGLRQYLAGTGAPEFSQLNVSDPGFFSGVNSLLPTIPLSAWKQYLTWQLLTNYAPWLSDKFVQEDFKFQQALTGQKELAPRWKRCVNATDANIGEALGQLYVEAAFPPESKQRMLKMVDEIEMALHNDLATLDWLAEPTREQALAKLVAIRNKIGYPDKWRDYSKLQIVRGDLFGNVSRATAFESNREWQEIGKPVDRSEWQMTPPTVNAYYRGDRNEIVFPAGFMQPPFFDQNEDDAVNFGGIGVFIGHELTHGFDDEGRKYDAAGNLRDWWTPKDAEEFDRRASCFVNEYGSFTAVDDLKLNGKLTLGENTADNGGARLSLMALSLLGAETGQGQAADGYSPEQRFFLAYARAWCQNMTPEITRVLTRSDPHSPGRWRVNGVLQNLPQFQEAFSCKKGQPMVREPACRVW